MASPAHTLIDLVAKRVRDPQNFAHSRAFVLARLSDAQRFINGALGLVTTTTTLSTLPRKLIYTLSGDLTTTLRPLSVREYTRDLCKLANLNQLNHLDLHWFRSLGHRFEAWCPIGRDLIVIYPAKDVASTVTVVHVKLLDVLAAEADTTEIPDEYLEAVLTLTEAMLLIRQRDLAGAQAAIKRLVETLGLDMTAYRLHLMGPEGMEAKGTVRQK